MCGVVGVFSDRDVNQYIYDALTVLQHRGQESAGMISCRGGKLTLRRSLGHVSDVFQERHLRLLEGNIGIGHVRYSTSGSSQLSLSQPFYVNSPYGIALGHNGQLVNTAELRATLFETDNRHLNTDSDSEVILNVFASELQVSNKPHLDPEDIFTAIARVHQRCQGAYACTALIANHGLLGFRDPFGIRPLVLGKRESRGQIEYMIASESSALLILEFELVRDLAPGEAVFIDTQGRLHSKQCAENPRLTPCIFEHVYFSRPDSMMDGIHIYKTRLRQGEKLAEKILRTFPEQDIDVVVPVPDTSRVASQSLAEKLGLKLREGLMKNRYIGRTFIMPGQEKRRRSVRRKLSVIELEVRNKVVLLIDDSIVRGTTSKEIIKMLRQAKAKKVYLASAAPQVRYPNIYGIDIPCADELVAYKRTDEEIASYLGADRVIYQDLDDFIASSSEGNPEVNQFECSVFTGDYVVRPADKAYLSKLKKQRNNKQLEEQSRRIEEQSKEYTIPLELTDIS